MTVDPTETSLPMNCAELGRALDAYLDGELAPQEGEEVASHLAHCDACRLVADREGRAREAMRAHLKAAMGAGASAGVAPDPLRERIQRALANERRPLLRRLVSPLPVATAMACAAGIVVVLATHGRPDPLAEEAVRKHTRDLPLEISAAGLGPDSVSGWLAGKLDFNAAPPRFSRGDVRLVGARLSHIQDRPAAYVRYELPRGHLGLFILDDPDRRFGEAGRPLRAGPATVRLVNSRGFNVAVWRRNEIVYSLVSDLDEADLARLVQAAQGSGDRP